LSWAEVFAPYAAVLQVPGYTLHIVTIKTPKRNVERITNGPSSMLRNGAKEGNSLRPTTHMIDRPKVTKATPVARDIATE
jgi:hypothetical protein